MTSAAKSDPESVITPADYERLAIRFKKYCAPPDKNGCIGWTGARDWKGYGICKWKNERFAHRVAWRLANREPIPQDLLVRHLCPEPKRNCVNSEHLATGTRIENRDDDRKAGRIPCGEKHRWAKMTEDVARKVIASFDNGQTRAERARQFGLKLDTIKAIDQGRQWAHLMSEEEIARRKAKIRHIAPVLSLETVRAIKRSQSTSKTRAERAKDFSVRVHVVTCIDEGRKFREVLADEEADKKRIALKQETADREHISSIQKRIDANSTPFVDENGEVHALWKGKTDTTESPRGTIRYFSRAQYVHVASFLASNNMKKMDPGKVVRHKCRFKHCTLVAHLESGTRKDNSADMIRDGTVQRGEKAYNATITEQTAKKIKLSNNCATPTARALTFSATRAQVVAIDRKTRWAWLDVEGAKLDDEDQRRLQAVQTFLQNIDKY